jgi:hypothetical protein
MNENKCPPPTCSIKIDDIDVDNKPETYNTIIENLEYMKLLLFACSSIGILFTFYGYYMKNQTLPGFGYFIVGFLVSIPSFISLLYTFKLYYIISEMKLNE